MAQHNRFLDYNPVADAFIPVDDATKKVMAETRQTIGDAKWKEGFTEEKRDQVRAILKENGVGYETKVSGKLMGINNAQTDDKNGGVHKKLRVVLESEQGTTILSADMDKDFAQDLVTKLDKAIQDQHAGKHVEVGTNTSPREYNGRTYQNHEAILRDAEGGYIPSAAGHFRAAQDIADSAQEPLKAQGMDKKVLNGIAASAREKYFTEVTEGLHNRMVEQGIAPTQAEKKGPLPGHEANLLSAERGANDEEKWYSLRVYPDKEGNLLATLTAQEDKNLISRQSKLEVKDGKDGGLVIRGDGFGAKIGEDRQVQFFEGKNKTPIQGKSKNTALLHPAKGTDITSPGMKNLQKILDTRLGQGKDRNVGKEV